MEKSDFILISDNPVMIQVLFNFWMTKQVVKFKLSKIARMILFPLPFLVQEEGGGGGCIPCKQSPSNSSFQDQQVD